MGSMLDYITSLIIFGILLITVTRVHGNLDKTMGQSTFNLTTQRSGIELARQIEHDFLKIGHRVKGAKIFTADTNRIIFRSDLANNHDTVFVQYRTGTTAEAEFTSNPSDFPLYRTVKGVTIKQNFGLTDFHITYFDSVHQAITTPITLADSLKKIRTMLVRFTVMSADPATDGIDTVWSAITWEKLLIPRNLTKLDL